MLFVIHKEENNTAMVFPNNLFPCLLPQISYSTSWSAERSFKLRTAVKENCNSHYLLTELSQDNFSVFCIFMYYNYPYKEQLDLVHLPSLVVSMQCPMLARLIIPLYNFQMHCLFLQALLFSLKYKQMANLPHLWLKMKLFLVLQ